MRNVKYPPHWAIFNTCFGSQCFTTKPSMSHMRAPFITVHRTFQSLSMFCCRLIFYVFRHRQKISLFYRRHKPFMLCYNEKLFVLLLARTINLQMKREMQRDAFQIFSKNMWMGVLKTLLGFCKHCIIKEVALRFEDCNFHVILYYH